MREEAISAGRIEAPRRGRLSRIGLRAVKAAAAVALAVGISVALLRPSFNRNDDMASIAPVMSQKSSQTSFVPALEEGRTLNIRVPEESRESVKPQPEHVETAPAVVETPRNNETTIRMNASDRYCLVVASLPSMALAEKFVSENKDANLAILNIDGKYRVYAATGNTINEALKCRDVTEIGGRFADAWVCSMR